MGGQRDRQADGRKRTREKDGQTKRQSGIWRKKEINGWNKTDKQREERKSGTDTRMDEQETMDQQKTDGGFDACTRKQSDEKIKDPITKEQTVTWTEKQIILETNSTDA